MGASYFTFSRGDYWFILVFGIIVLSAGVDWVRGRESPTWIRLGRAIHYAGEDAVFHGWIKFFGGVAAIIFSIVNLI